VRTPVRCNPLQSTILQRDVCIVDAHDPRSKVMGITIISAANQLMVDLENKLINFPARL
jgi:hypothetical protein